MNSVAEAIEQRMSVRAFTKEAVSHEQILKLLNLSARAPSGTNTQPWKAYVLEGEKLNVLCEQVCKAYDDIASNPELAKDFQEAILAEGTMAGAFQANFAIFTAKNVLGWRDKVEQEISGPNGKELKAVELIFVDADVRPDQPE